MKHIKVMTCSDMEAESRFILRQQFQDFIFEPTLQTAEGKKAQRRQVGGFFVVLQHHKNSTLFR